MRPPTPPSARVAVLAAASAFAGSLPLPVLPTRAVRALRGALAHEAFGRRGLALTAEARAVLADPGWLPARGAGLLRDTLQFVASRVLVRLAPLGAVAMPTKSAYEVLVLGRLLDRYLDQHRSRAPHGKLLRVERAEATQLRGLIEEAARVALIGPVAPALPEAREPAEDFRGTFERVVDTAILGVSGLPEIVGARLDAAFDAAALVAFPEGGAS